MCYYLNLHKSHKLLKIDDEEELKKENISLEDSTKDLNENKNRIEELKNKIEKEMIEIDKLYVKIDKEVTDSYKIKYEKLVKEENELKDKLKNEVTKIKENFELNLSKINEIIIKSERIIKGLQILYSDKEIQIIKKLNYISNINKNIKGAKFLIQEPMKNLKIKFNENENNIVYEQYYFNGLQLPKDIQFSEIGTNSYKISWKIDDIKLLNIDNKNIKYKVELRKEKDKFNLVYEGNNTNCIINNLEIDTNYEIRICSFYNNLISNWSQILKVKTNFCIDSKILANNERRKEYINKIFEWAGCKSMELLYRGTRDGMTGKDFHNKCDNKGKTICLFLNDKDNIFGGYSSIPWQNSGGDKTSNDCFIFTLSNIHNTEPTKFPYKSGRSVFHYSNDGPSFGSGTDLRFGYDKKEFNAENSNYSCFPNSYQDNLGKGKSVFTGNLNNEYFILKEIEVFKIL